MKVENEVMALLSASRTEGNKLFITGGQLEKNLYQRLDKTLKAAGGKWNTKAKAHLFDGDAADAIENILLTGEVTVPQDFGFFPTPPHVAKQAADLAMISDGMMVLEPSAGRGALAVAANAAASGVIVDMHELLPENHKALIDLKLPLSGVFEPGDFLQVEPKAVYDRVLMNPPFDKKRSDIHHVVHALKFLKPGGRLVAIMPSGVTFRDDALTRGFRGIIQERGGRIETLPEASFKQAGTMVNTVLVVIPAAA
ncbi:class I SAM-dependent methyltransferase [Pseudomonas sp. CCOS 191]|uniref:class I SAM-dependent methyltransferase n=1 Tax=Pseudomonas sp. CCOS 191 TaxID=1649877 RepID=UPI0006245CB8|nr:class I SAM-dependent methyltransferase [Pseudomonas sp. CCOS 191]CRI56366.1 restriction endonuclease subunit M [Pseudomonas sp. CCOS 191]